MSDQARITPSDDGPLLIKGAFVLVDSEGNEFDTKPSVALCRCGASDNKPFCDGSHRRIDFESRVRAPEKVQARGGR